MKFRPQLWLNNNRFLYRNSVVMAVTDTLGVLLKVATLGFVSTDLTISVIEWMAHRDMNARAKKEKNARP
jgi:hypothetical protein